MKEWWQKIFSSLVGEAMFGPRQASAGPEVKYILNQVKLQPGAAVLDLACGVGRHSVYFARRKFHVIGLDYSDVFLKEAKSRTKKENLKVRFVQGDMKNLKPHFQNDQFDFVVSLFNSFGYFKKRSDDEKMLREVYRVLKPGAFFLLNTLNGDGVAKALRMPISRGHEPIKNVFMLDNAHYDPGKRKTYAKWTIIDTRKKIANVQRVQFDQNIYTHSEIKYLLKKAGFEVVKTWGWLHGEKFNSKKSWHQSVLVRKSKPK
jgi:ubiquinone/menaquinone biosynthesis C-methylase UbiE